MPKTFINFEEVDIDVYAIKSIERDVRWNDKEQMMKFVIIINNRNRIRVDTFTPEYVFEFGSYEYRDIMYDELKQKLSTNDCKFV